MKVITKTGNTKKGQSNVREALEEVNKRRSVSRWRQRQREKRETHKLIGECVEIS